MSNAEAYLPLLKDNQNHEIQTAANAGIRAVCRLPKHGQAPMSLIRDQLKIPSVETVCLRVRWAEAWKRKSSTGNLTGPMTRGRAAGNVPIPDLRGWNGKRIETLALATWNELPASIKNETDRKKAMAMIKKMCT